MNLAELVLALILQTKEVKSAYSHNNIHSVNSQPYYQFVPGDSLAQREQAERDRHERSRKEVLAREKAERASRTSTYQTAAGNGYVWGNCTYYVKSQKPQVPNGYGDARYWPINTSVPAVGAIIVTYESWRGHVGIVREVNGTQVKIEEMNYVGWNRVSTRVVDYRTIPVKGFLII